MLGFFIIALRLTGARRILQAAQAVSGKARSPLAHGGRAHPQSLRDRLGRMAGGGRQDDARAHRKPLFAGRRPSPVLQGRAIFFRQRWGSLFGA